MRGKTVGTGTACHTAWSDRLLSTDFVQTPASIRNSLNCWARTPNWDSSLAAGNGANIPHTAGELKAACDAKPAGVGLAEVIAAALNAP